MGWFILLGDSKTARSGWPVPLASQALQRDNRVYMPKNGGVEGATVATASAGIAAILANMPDDPDGDGPILVLMNWGANDMLAMPVQATFEANYLTIIDAVHTKWPTALIYLARPWRQGKATESTTLATYIANVRAARSSYTFLGMDERVWLEGGDNGATNSSDGVHYTTAGYTAAANAWTAVLFP